ncbi:MAG TPA: hypothetical protein K8W04_10390 [Bacteroides reticulotermitis]|nr:hypothetical protein [Bacteroides reticulotermitis]
MPSGRAVVCLVSLFSVLFFCSWYVLCRPCLFKER